MPTAKRQDWIPTQNDDIYNKLGAYLGLIVANKVAWGISDAAISPLVDLQEEFEPLYHKIQDKRTRTSADVTAFNDCKKRLLKEWRAFHKENVRGNRRISTADLATLVGKEYDTEPSPRGKIELVPYVFLKPLGGGVIEVRSQTEKDATRVSMHKLADGIECRWMLVPKGEMPPEGYEDAKKTVVSRKARFTIDCGDKNAGDSFYGFFRWVNTSNPANSGLWTKALRVVIA
jgi:hypothetical protein